MLVATSYLWFFHFQYQACGLCFNKDGFKGCDFLYRRHYPDRTHGQWNVTLILFSFSSLNLIANSLIFNKFFFHMKASYYGWWLLHLLILVTYVVVLQLAPWTYCYGLDVFPLLIALKTYMFRLYPLKYFSATCHLDTIIVFVLYLRSWFDFPNVSFLFLVEALIVLDYWVFLWPFSLPLLY